MSDSEGKTSGINALNPVCLLTGEIVNTAVAGRVDPTKLRCHRKGCTSLGWKYMHNKCSEQNKHKHNWAYCESCYKDAQNKSKESSKKYQKRKTMEKSLIKGAELLVNAGVKLMIPDNAPAEIKKLVQEMKMETIEAEAKEASHKDNVMTAVELSEAVFEDFMLDPEALHGGYFSTGHTYQIICAGVQLFQKGKSQLSFVTSPQNMIRSNHNLGEYVAWHDDEGGNTWKRWLQRLLGSTKNCPNINATVMENLIDTLLAWYTNENQAEYFVKFGILRTKKAGRQVRKFL